MTDSTQLFFSQPLKAATPLPSHPISILDGHRPTTAPDRERDYHPGVEFQGIGSHGAPLVDPSYDFHPDTEFQGLGSSGAPLTDPARDYHPGVEFDGLDASGGPWAGLDTEAAVQSLGLSPMQAAETLAQQPVSRLSENDVAFGHILDIRENKAHPQNAKAQTLIGDWVSHFVQGGPVKTDAAGRMEKPAYKTEPPKTSALATLANQQARRDKAARQARTARVAAEKQRTEDIIKASGEIQKATDKAAKQDAKVAAQWADYHEKTRSAAGAYDSTPLGRAEHVEARGTPLADKLGGGLGLDKVGTMETSPQPTETPQGRASEPEVSNRQSSTGLSGGDSIHQAEATLSPAPGQPKPGTQWHTGKTYGPGELTPADTEYYVVGNSEAAPSDNLSDRVICTELYRQGLLDRPLYVLDLRFTAKHLSPAHVRGYHFWALPLVRAMRRSPRVTRWVRPFAIARARELAHRMMPHRYPPHWPGKLVRLIGEPASWLLGQLVGPSSLQVSRPDAVSRT
ncbi:hypothetical protein [Magnetospira sp. QH-2]|uniref:hypothetical protein n=1 Tax=Magnetospira sp. (strain QH-2) TaxID=1288970 RepID=UPI0003E8100F|nr:hypothetical protein [Magnetospira sp. QH-2]CCQ72334.1 protein of unknown function [Magnetospira sp. QH-2]